MALRNALQEAFDSIKRLREDDDDILTQKSKRILQSIPQDKRINTGNTEEDLGTRVTRLIAKSPVGRGLESAQNKVENLRVEPLRKFGANLRTLDIPTSKYADRPVIGIPTRPGVGEPVSMGLQQIGAISRLLEGELRDKGAALEAVSTPEGRQSIGQGFARLKDKPLEELQTLGTDQPNPALATFFTAVDIPDAISLSRVAAGSAGIVAGLAKTSDEFLTVSPNAFKQFHPEDLDIMRKFVDEVDKSPRKNLGQLGLDAQRITEKYIGKEFATMSNNRLKKVFQKVLDIQEKIPKSEQSPLPRKVRIGRPPGSAAAGAVAGIERDEEGDISFDPVKGGLGIVGISLVGATKGDDLKVIDFGEASEHVAKRVGVPDDPGLLSKVRGFYKGLKGNLVDSFSPIEDTITQIEKEGLTISGKGSGIEAVKDPRLLRNRVLGAGSIAKQMMSEKLEPVLKQVGPDDLEQFDQYLAARLEVDLAERGFDTAMDPNQAKVFVQNLAPKYEDQAKQVTQFTRDVLEYVKDGGLISDETFQNLINKYPNYVPLQRVFDEDLADKEFISAGGKAVGSLSKQTVVQAREGSERKIIRPLSSIVENTMNAVGEVERNRVAQSIANLRRFDQFEDVIKKVDKKGNKPAISVFEGGQKVFYRVPEEFEEAAKNLNKETMSTFLKVVSIPARIARVGFTGLHVPFAATNIVRDQLFGTLTSRNAAKTSLANPYNFIQSLMDSVKKRGAYDEFLASGGGYSTFFSVGRGKAVPEVENMARSQPEKVKHIIKTPKEWLSAVEELMSRTEEATRTQQFRGTKEALGAVEERISAFDRPTEVSLKALRAGRENTTDFAKKGAYGHILNSVFIYLNAGIQGTRTMVNAFKRNPKGTSFKVGTTLFTPVALATLWNTATPERRKAYMDISDWERNNNLIILPPDPNADSEDPYTDAIKIPLPQGFSALTIPIRAAIEHMSGVDQSSPSQVLMDTIGQAGPVDVSSVPQLASRVTPTATLPILENFTNKKFFVDAPIVPRSKEDLPASMQSAHDTSGFLKIAGQALNMSPAKIQNLVESYTGSLGETVLNTIDKGLAAAGVIDPEDIGGEGWIEEIQRRFGKAHTGKLRDMRFKELEPLEQRAAVRTEKERKAAELIYEQLKELPQQQWRPFLANLKEDGILNERIYNRIENIALEKKFNITASDRFAKSLPVQERAIYIQGQMDKIPTESGKLEFLKEMKNKKILTESVWEVLTDQNDQEDGRTRRSLRTRRVRSLRFRQ